MTGRAASRPHPVRARRPDSADEPVNRRSVTGAHPSTSPAGCRRVPADHGVVGIVSLQGTVHRHRRVRSDAQPGKHQGQLCAQAAIIAVGEHGRGGSLPAPRRRAGRNFVAPPGTPSGGCGRNQCAHRRGGPPSRWPMRAVRRAGRTIPGAPPGGTAATKPPPPGCPAPPSSTYRRDLRDGRDARRRRRRHGGRRPRSFRAHRRPGGERAHAFPPSALPRVRVGGSRPEGQRRAQGDPPPVPGRCPGEAAAPKRQHHRDLEHLLEAQQRRVPRAEHRQGRGRRVRAIAGHRAGPARRTGQHGRARAHPDRCGDADGAARQGVDRGPEPDAPQRVARGHGRCRDLPGERPVTLHDRHVPAGRWRFHHAAAPRRRFFWQRPRRRFLGRDRSTA
ncbi:hypothetical protein FHX34_104756 [Actinoplanes teichomyceticus]|uniref:Uncharacterized protein n=1 Tax=Actinoplanes teichomyceticus TaxID=1867 RepID=A0A561VS72_ACTTI|nr:hypothetical protein FHX34_104756 [Actinoplanes teichomyceticus]